MNFMTAVFASVVLPCSGLEPEGAMNPYPLYTLHSEILDSEQTVMLSVPSMEGENEYPVLVILDGSQYFCAFASIVQALSNYGGLPEMIVAGVDCPDPVVFYTPTNAAVPDGTPMPGSGRAEEYLRFLEQELLTAIEDEFSTASYTVLFGHSLAGMFTLYALEEENGVFEGFIASSPSLWWDDELLVSKLDLLDPPPDARNWRVFVSLGNEGETMEGPVERYRDQAEGIESMVLRYMDFPGSGHQQVPFKSFIYGIEYIFEPWQMESAEGLETLKDHYEELGDIYGYDVIPPEAEINGLGYRLIADGDMEGALEAFRLNVEYYPESGNVYDSLGEALLLAGDTLGAIDNYRLSLELDPGNDNAYEILERLESPVIP